MKQYFQNFCLTFKPLLPGHPMLPCRPCGPGGPLEPCRTEKKNPIVYIYVRFTQARS